jgi:CcmD family protein
MRGRSVVGRLAILTATLWLAAGPALVAAQEPQSQFVPADSLPQETLPAAPLVFAAYGFAWVALLAYVFGLWRRLGRVERELADVRARLAARKP